MMEWIWAVITTALISFCLWVTYRIGYIRGFKRGARNILNQWKRTLFQEDDIDG